MPVLRPNYRPYCKHARPTQCSASKCIARSQFPVCSCGACGAACVPDEGASDRESSSPCRLPGSQEAASLPAVPDCTHLSVGCVAAQSQDARAPQRWAECWRQLHGGRETGGNEALQAAARAYQLPSYVHTQVRTRSSADTSRLKIGSRASQITCIVCARRALPLRGRRIMTGVFWLRRVLAIAWQD
jgi:hypothetical protein